MKSCDKYTPLANLLNKNPQDSCLFSPLFIIQIPSQNKSWKMHSCLELSPRYRNKMCVKSFKMNRNESPECANRHGWLWGNWNTLFKITLLTFRIPLIIRKSYAEKRKRKLVRKTINQDGKKKTKKSKWFTQSLIHLVIRVSNLKLLLNKVVFWPEYQFHYYRSFKIVLKLHTSLFFQQHL